MKKSTIKKVAGLAFMVGGMFAVQSTQAVLFDFNNGNDLDSTGPGASMTVDGLTLTTYDIIGQDGSSALAGTNNTMNSTSNDALGVNSDNNVGGYDNDARDFNPGEKWIYSFDKDVNLIDFDFSGWTDDNSEMTLSSTAFASDFVFWGTVTGDTFVLPENTLVTAGTQISLYMTDTLTPGGSTDVEVRLPYLNVDVIPEPATLGLLSACAIGAFALRRFRI